MSQQLLTATQVDIHLPQSSSSAQLIKTEAAARVLPEYAVVVQQGRDAAVLLQHNRVALPSGEKGNSQAPLPAKVPTVEGESKV